MPYLESLFDKAGYFPNYFERMEFVKDVIAKIR